MACVVNDLVAATDSGVKTEIKEEIMDEVKDEDKEESPQLVSLFVLKWILIFYSTREFDWWGWQNGTDFQNNKYSVYI